MLNSRNYTSDATIINAGEQIAPEVDLKDPNTKVYYHRVPGAVTHLPDGAQLQFLGGQFATANAEIKTFLDKIADKRGTQVYTKVSPESNLDQLLAASAAAAPAGDAKTSLESGEVDENMAAAMARREEVKLEPDQARSVAAQLKPGVVPAVKQ